MIFHTRKFTALAFLVLFIGSLTLLTGITLSPNPPSEINILIDGRPLAMDVAPIIKDGRTLVPMRAIFEALGAKVDWYADTQSIKATKGIITVTMKIGSDAADISGVSSILDVAAIIYNNRTLVPLRFVGESLGAKVDWDGDARIVRITSNGGTTVSGNFDSTPGARAFYVSSTSGSNSNDGTFASPWKTIQKAADNVKAGDTVYVRGGTYKEKVEMKTSGTSGSYITFRNYPGETPVIDGTGLKTLSDEASGSLVYIEDKSYIKVIGFRISNLVSYDSNVPAGIRIEGSSKNIEIRNNKVYGIKTTYNGSSDRNAHGIVAYGTDGTSSLDGLVIDNCEVYGCVLGSSESLVLNGNVTNFKVTNNKIHDNDNIGIDFIGYEGKASANDYVRNGICSGNQVWNISSGSNAVYRGDKSADGIYVDGGAHITIEGNKVWNVDIGIECASEHENRSTSYIIVRNNLVYNCSGYAGLSIGGSGDTNGSADHIELYNNTVYNNRYNLALQENCQVSTNIVRNNIFYMFKESNIDGDKTNIVVSNNITTNPGFVAAGSDFHLKSGSNAINAGMNDDSIGHKDMDGKPRISGGKVDCGCYEKQ